MRLRLANSNTMNTARRWFSSALLAASFASAGAASLQVQVQEPSGKPLAEAVVFLESRDAKAASKPLQNAEIGQAARQFTPQVNVVTVGTSVTFPNRDTVRHHVYSFSPAKTFELKLYTGTLASPVVFDKPGIAVLGCNIHDNMAAWVVIVETPYFGRSGADGKLTLDIADVSNAAFAAVRTAGGAKTQLYQIDLDTGRARFVGTVADGGALLGMAIEP